ncbi:MAG TPA: type II toxin-antitoxin system RelE/ParE family toxin [Asticcacaulis sp.]|nr:type II toxin-antitoxin system RelE/ParE family toxin [Asticcacaulis sp.]
MRKPAISLVMAKYVLSRKAEADLTAIVDFSLETFGIEQARLYYDGLINAFNRIAGHPQVGAAFDYIKPNTRRWVHGSHVIYYRMDASSVFIRRILHQSQDPLRHL